MPDARDPRALRSALLVRLFCRYVRWDVARRFHAVRILREAAPRLPAGRPAIIYSNHPSWWDPALYFVLGSRFLPDRIGYGPMDAAALARYGIFTRLGVFGIDPTSRGAARFLMVATNILSDPNSVLWVTAEGEFTDARLRPVNLRPGIAHLARRIPDLALIPLALEYPFWNESRPEALAAFGAPLDADPIADVATSTRRLETELTATMDRLSAAAAGRDARKFETIVEGGGGVGGPYDLWRRLRAAAAGRSFDPRHEGDAG